MGQTKWSVTDTGPEDLAPLASADLNSSILWLETVQLLKDKVENRMTTYEFTDKILKKVTTLKLISKKQADWETNFKGARTMSYQSSRSSLYDQMDGGKMTEEEEKAKQKT